MNKKSYYLISLCVFLALAIAAIVLPSTATGDSGDSIMHYFYSLYAFRYPALFFDHWAKPVFVLLSSPFAQAGFEGVRLFNVICLTLTAHLTFLIAKKLNAGPAWFAPLAVLFSPLCLQLAFSGLTEYLFALLLAGSVYSLLCGRFRISAVLVSFLPLVRSEGLILLPVFAGLALFSRQYRILPWFLAGQVLYALAGAILYKDLLWVFSEIPYAQVTPRYGHGGPLDFFHRLNYVIEKPIYLLLIAGIASVTASRKIRQEPAFSIMLLVTACFLLFFAAHGLFWWLGLFKSMGLPRVLIAVIPLIAVLATLGLHTLSNLWLPAKRYVVAAAVLAVVIYPFTARPLGIVYGPELFSVPDNEVVEREVRPLVNDLFPDAGSRVIYTSHPYVMLALGADPFDYRHFGRLDALKAGGPLPPGSAVIWDNLYAATESFVTLEELSRDDRLKLIRNFEGQLEGRKIQFVLFTSR